MLARIVGVGLADLHCTRTLANPTSIVLNALLCTTYDDVYGDKYGSNQ